MSQFPGVFLSVSSTALQKGYFPDTPLYRAVLNNFCEKRSGNIYLVFKPNWFINDFDGFTVASTHGSPWQYDTFVPIVFASAGLKAKKITRKVYIINIAPTLSAVLQTKPPSGVSGHVLTDLFDKL